MRKDVKFTFWNWPALKHLQAAGDHKINKVEYQLLLSELDRLGYISQYLSQTQSGPYKP